MPIAPSPNGIFQFVDDNIALNGSTLLSGIGSAVSRVDDTLSNGVFMKFTAETPKARHIFPLGNIEGIRRFTSCYRDTPFWMKAKTGTRGGEIPIETQFLLVELADSTCVLFAPILDSGFRCSLQGATETGLELVAESGDPSTVATEVTGLFIAAGPEPYALIEYAAESVMERLGTRRSRGHCNRPPDFADKFGWCTWDAFYQEVSHDKVREGLASFAAGGVSPKYIILDDGWQSEVNKPSGERRLTGFPANGKFPGDLGVTVQMAKGEFGIETFLVWHAVNGYWGGVDDEALPGYGARVMPRAYSPGIRSVLDKPDEGWWATLVSVVSKEHIYRFYHDYHRHLRLQGVDGVKVDNQASLEGLAVGQGGRVALMRSYHEALEGSVHTHLNGNLINCMSCSTDMFYSTLTGGLTRTSDDYYPNKPESHGVHIYANTMVSAWFGQFIAPDWDMFQSGHPMGAYHAAARAVGGCPVYVSDKPGAHDFDLLRKLVLPDGSVLRASRPGRPTRDCLFHDPTKEDVLLKIFNTNMYSEGLLGVFNARYSADEADARPITGTISPADVSDFATRKYVAERFAVYAHNSGELRAMGLHDKWEITLPQLTCEVFTIIPIKEGVGPIGLAEMFNSGGALVSYYWSETEKGVYELWVKAGGRVLIWSERTPLRVEMDEKAVEFTFDTASNRLEIQVPKEGEDGGLPGVRIWFE